MLTESELPAFAETLRRRGLDAEEEIIYGPNRRQVGLRLGRDFYPLWELSDPANAAFLSALAFNSIRLNRPPGWSIDTPDEKKKLARADYQNLYREALKQIRSAGDQVGEPYLSKDGVRAVHVNDYPFVDQLIFTKVWGEETAQDIMRRVAS